MRYDYFEPIVGDDEPYWTLRYRDVPEPFRLSDAWVVMTDTLPLVQNKKDAFIAAFRRADRFRGEAAVTTWLHRITVNCAIDRVRRQRPMSPLPEIDPADAHDRHGEAETALDVRAALATLPEAQRLALVLVDMHGLSIAEAASVLEVAEGTVKSRCSRGRAALAPLLAHRRDREPEET